jgi:hypothetical protein
MGILLIVLAASVTSPNVMSQPELDAISAKCQTPRRWLVNKAGEIHLRPARTAKYEKVDCLLAALRKNHAGPMGFIGNEAYDPNPRP